MMQARRRGFLGFMAAALPLLWARRSFSFGQWVSASPALPPVPAVQPDRPRGCPFCSLCGGGLDALLPTRLRADSPASLPIVYAPTGSLYELMVSGGRIAREKAALENSRNGGMDKEQEQ